MKIIGKNFIKAVCFALIIAFWSSLVAPIIQFTNGKQISGSIYTFADSFCDRKAYIGGYPIGLSIKPEGAIVAAIVSIETSAGQVTPTTEILPGDIIQEINSTKILYCADIIEVLKSVNIVESLKIIVKRAKNTLSVKSTLIKEDLTGVYKLGLAVKDSILGVGTVTFVKPDSTFACLGHPITFKENGAEVPCFIGNAFDCKILGYNKGQRGNPGELKGVFTSSIPCGLLFKNNKYGAFGKLNQIKSDAVIYDIGSRNSVVIGKAKILTTINSKAEFYNIEIMKALNQSSPNDKSMIIRVTDPKLLEFTGGILQGMSGSPIIQNNKIIGAVTHVFVNDPTKGYGIYADWMYDN